VKNINHLVQLPPPVHGAALVNQRVCDIAERSSELKNTIYRLNYAQNFEQMHAPARIKLAYTIRLLMAVIAGFFKNKPAITYLAFSPFGAGFYRDLFLVGLALTFRSKPCLHLHGAGLSKNSSAIKALLLKWMLSKSTLIVISESLLEDLSPYLGKGTVVTVNNCVDDPGAVVRDQNKDVIRVLYLANLDERKGVKIAIEAFSRLIVPGKRFELFVAGSDTARLSRKNLQSFIDEKYPQLTSCIFLLGPVYGEEKASFFQSGDLFLYPSQHDAAPLVVLEALSYGLPVICSNQGALPDMIQDGVNGYVSKSNNPSEYAELMLICQTDLDTLSKRARETYLSKYTPDIFEQKILDLFLNGAPNGPH